MTLSIIQERLDNLDKFGKIENTKQAKEFIESVLKDNGITDDFDNHSFPWICFQLGQMLQDTRGNSAIPAQITHIMLSKFKERL